MRLQTSQTLPKELLRLRFVVKMFKEMFRVDCLNGIVVKRQPFCDIPPHNAWKKSHSQIDPSTYGIPAAADIPPRSVHRLTSQFSNGTLNYGPDSLTYGPDSLTYKAQQYDHPF